MCCKGRRARRVAGTALAVSLAGCLFAGCGKKGDPEPPLLPVPQAASDLTVEQRGSELILRFAYPRTTAAGMPLPPLERVEVYELARPAAQAPVPPAPATPPAAGATAAPEPATTEGEGGIARFDFESGSPEPAADQPAPAGRLIVPQVDAREFAAAAAVVRTLRGDELAGAVHGDRLVVSLPVALPLPEPPQARLFAVRTVAVAEHLSAFSNRAGIVPEPPPRAPTGLGATARPDGVEIAWELESPAEPAASPVGFHVYRRLATERGFGAPLRLVGPAQRSFLDTGARYGQRYVYAVTAVARRTPVVESAIAAAREVDYRDVFAPPVPAGLVALADAGAVRLVWDESTAADLAGYRVHRRRGDGEWQALTAEPIDAAEYQDRDVAAGETYGYRVTAVDALGNESEPSAAAEALAR